MTIEARAEDFEDGREMRAVIWVEEESGDEAGYPRLR